MKRQITPRILPSNPFPSVRPPTSQSFHGLQKQYDQLETVFSEHESVGNTSHSLSAWPWSEAGDEGRENTPIRSSCASAEVVVKGCWKGWLATEAHERLEVGQRQAGCGCLLSRGTSPVANTIQLVWLLEGVLPD